MRAINKEEATLETAFEQKLIAGTKAGAFVTDKRSDLAGLTDVFSFTRKGALKSH